MITKLLFRKKITNSVSMLSGTIIGMAGLLVAMAAPISANAAGSSAYTLFGDSMLVHPGNNSFTAAQIESSATVSSMYGGVDFGVPAGVTNLSSLNNLSTDYMFTQGSCGSGAPRFQVAVTTPSGPKNMFVYIGPAPDYSGCPQNIWSNTGNLVTGTSLVDTSQLGGTFYDSYASAQAAFGSYPVTDVSLVTDGGTITSTQTVQLDNVQINNNSYGFESADSCKNGGWQQFTSNPGPFKNQGDCVSFFNSNDNKN